MRIDSKRETNSNKVMKTNAPEKLYLHPAAYGKVGASWLTFPLTNEDIEYVRTDAFIEKACNAFCSVCNMPNCNGSKECSFVIKFRESLMQKL